MDEGDDNVIKLPDWDERYRRVFQREPPSETPKIFPNLENAKEKSLAVFEGYKSLKEIVDAAISELDMERLDKNSRHELEYFAEQLSDAVDYFTDVQAIVAGSSTYEGPIKLIHPQLLLPDMVTEEVLQHNVKEIIYGFADINKATWAEFEMQKSLIGIMMPIDAYEDMAENFDPRYPNLKPKYLKAKRMCQHLAHLLAIPVVSFGIGYLRATNTEFQPLEDFALMIGIPLALKAGEHLYKHGLTVSRLSVKDLEPILLGAGAYLAGNMGTHLFKNL